MYDTTIKTSELSSKNVLVTGNTRFLILDKGTTTQGAQGSTMSTPASAVIALVANAYNLKNLSNLFTTVSDNSANWLQDTSLVYNTFVASTSIDFDASITNEFIVPLSGTGLSATFNTPTNQNNSQIVTVNIRFMDTIDSVNLTSGYRVPLSISLDWSLSAGYMDIMTVKYNHLDFRWDVINFASGYVFGL